jgi:hypothetical protein
MTRLSSVLALLAVIGLGSTARGDPPVVYCGCAQGEFNGPGQYAYTIDSNGYPISEFFVGTNDVDLAHYTSVLIPPNWNFEISPWGFSQSYGTFSYHSYMPGTPGYGLTAGSARWWTDDPANAIESFTFGFEHPWPAEDVGWGMMVRWGGEPPDLWFAESWEAPTGMGAGPLHGPGRPAEACWESDECEPGNYCYFSDCLVETGLCLPQPPDCEDVCDPVCGCDGVSYRNVCFAALAGSSVARQGACLTGDLDLDSDVDLADLAQLLGNYSTSEGATYEDGDLDGDGDVDLSDLTALLENYGQERA